MTMKKRRELKPRLRFPEFRDAKGWRNHPLKEFLLKSPEYGVNASAEAYSCNLPTYLRITDISEDGAYVPNKKASVRVLPTDGNSLLEGDIVLARTGASVGKSYKYKKNDGQLVFAGYLIRVRPNPEKLNPCFLFIFLFTNQYWKWVGITSSRSGQPGINGSEYAELPIPVPSNINETGLKEQTKIAACISSLADLIAVNSQKLNTLQAYKDGLMQQLFPAEGESVPKLRFPEFCNAGKWNKKKAGSLFENRTEEGEASLPIYSVTMNQGMIKRSLLERNFDDIAEPAGNKKAHKNDIAYNMMRMWQGACGVAPENCMVSPAYVILSPCEGVCPDFFGYLLKLPEYLRLLTSHSQGLTLDRLRLYYKDFAHIPVQFPAFPEQQKIATFLKSLDNLIALHAQKLDLLKAHKKGLMQQLFPAPEEAAK